MFSIPESDKAIKMSDRLACRVLSTLVETRKISEVIQRRWMAHGGKNVPWLYGPTVVATSYVRTMRLGIINLFCGVAVFVGAILAALAMGSLIKNAGMINTHLAIASTCLFFVAFAVSLLMNYVSICDNKDTSGNDICRAKMFLIDLAGLAEFIHSNYISHGKDDDLEKTVLREALKIARNVLVLEADAERNAVPCPRNPEGKAYWANDTDLTEAERGKLDKLEKAIEPFGLTLPSRKQLFDVARDQIGVAATLKPEETATTAP